MLCWFGAPVEALILILQSLDEAGKGLYDAVTNGPLNPILRCQRRLTQLLKEGVNGDLGPLFYGLSDAEKRALLLEVRTLGTDFGAQAMAAKTLNIRCRGCLAPVVVGWRVRIRFNLFLVGFS